MFVYPVSYKMSKDKMEIAVLLRGKVYKNSKHNCIVIHMWS